MIRLSKADDVKATVLNNGDIIVKYGGDYVHCYHGGVYCVDQILADIDEYEQTMDTSDWDGNEPELISIIEGDTYDEILFGGDDVRGYILATQLRRNN